VQGSQGSLHPELQPLGGRGWICAERGASENNRKARFSELTSPVSRVLDIGVTTMLSEIWSDVRLPSARAVRPRRAHRELDAELHIHLEA
jgi:hypothetical protein